MQEAPRHSIGSARLVPRVRTIPSRLSCHVFTQNFNPTVAVGVLPSGSRDVSSNGNISLRQSRAAHKRCGARNSAPRFLLKASAKHALDSPRAVGSRRAGRCRLCAGGGGRGATSAGGASRRACGARRCRGTPRNGGCEPRLLPHCVRGGRRRCVWRHGNTRSSPYLRSAFPVPSRFPALRARRAACPLGVGSTELSNATQLAKRTPRRVAMHRDETPPWHALEALALAHHAAASPRPPFALLQMGAAR